MDSKRIYRRLRHRVLRRWDRIRAPWPIVGECHSDHLARHSCAQCSEGHTHRWAAWAKAPRWVTSGPGTPVRCRDCGARKCDAADCTLRRHTHQHASAS